MNPKYIPAYICVWQCTGSDGVVRLKCTKPEYQISCKTVLLGRAESKFIGGEVNVGENIESYEYSVSYCAVLL